MRSVAEGLVTLDQFLELPDQAGKQEFDRGRIIAMPPAKYAHALTAKKIYDRLTDALHDSDCSVFSETGFLVAPDIVRQPDVAVVETGKLETTPLDAYPVGAPLIAIEVASPADTAEELDLKIDQCLRNGSEAVWVAYPKRKAIVRFALNSGRVHAVEYKPGEALSEEVGASRFEIDPAEFF